LESLSCYSLYENTITAGITVGDFESVITVSPDTAVVKQAALQTEPVVAKVAQKDIGDFRYLAGVSMTFLHEITGKTKKSKTNCLLAVNPERWRLAKDVIPAAIVDPCGLHGHAILLLYANTSCALVSWHDPSMIVAVDENGKPFIRQMNRASLMLSAITAPLPVVTKPSRCLVAAR